MKKNNNINGLNTDKINESNTNKIHGLNTDKINGIGQKKFNKIITLFSSPEITDKLRADLFEEGVNDNVSITDCATQGFHENETFKSKLSMWETKLGSNNDLSQFSSKPISNNVKNNPTTVNVVATVKTTTTVSKSPVKKPDIEKTTSSVTSITNRLAPKSKDIESTDTNQAKKKTVTKSVKKIESVKDDISDADSFDHESKPEINSKLIKKKLISAKQINSKKPTKNITIKKAIIESDSSEEVSERELEIEIKPKIIKKKAPVKSTKTVTIKKKDKSESNSSEECETPNTNIMSKKAPVKTTKIATIKKKESDLNEECETPKTTKVSVKPLIKTQPKVVQNKNISNQINKSTVKPNVKPNVRPNTVVKKPITKNVKDKLESESDEDPFAIVPSNRK